MATETKEITYQEAKEYWLARRKEGEISLKIARELQDLGYDESIRHLLYSMKAWEEEYEKQKQGISNLLGINKDVLP